MRTHPNAQITRRIQPKQRTTQQAHRRSLSRNRTPPHAYRIHRNFRSRKSKHPSRSPSSALPGLPATRTRSASPSETNTFFASPPSGSPGRRIRRLASGAPLPPTLNLLHSRSAWAQVLLTRLLHRRAGVWRGRQSVRQAATACALGAFVAARKTCARRGAMAVFSIHGRRP